MTSADQHWMLQALELAGEAERHDEVPVGAVVVHEGQVIGAGYNRPVGAHDPTAHAEIQALRQAASRMGNYRLPGCTLYVTLEPCTMCVGAMVHARIQTLVFGAREPRFGAVVSARRLLDDGSAFNHQLQWREGVMSEACGSILKQFFRRRRAGSAELERQLGD